MIYPPGWRLDLSTGKLLGPVAEVAHAGDTVSIMGSLAGDIASTCQMGPMFSAVEVLEIAP